MARPVTVTLLENLRHEVRVGRHTLVIDEPVEQGGDDSGPSPYELLLAALGS
ncbi:MAG: OsmC family protein [Candidatus Methylomirabilia bacterium]